MTEFFHAYDLRGTYPDQIGLEEAERVGKAYGTWVDAETVIVGRDGRNHGEDVAEAFVEGVTSTGVDVLRAGMVPTPVVYFGAAEHGMHAAVVTASHNPPEYTGFKFAAPGALAVSREGGMAEIQEIYETGEFDEGEGHAGRIGLVDQYVEFVSDRIELEEPLEVAVNFGNGAACEVGRRVLEEIGCRVNGVNDEVDGSFPAHLPDPTDSEAQEALKNAMEDEDLGVLFDGDGDRAGFVVDGEYITEDETLALLAVEVLDDQEGAVIHDLRASKLVKETVRQHGGEPRESRVGHTFISEMIHDDPGVVFAGETSGHYYFPAMDAPWDDGILAAALMCRLDSENDLRRMVEQMPEYPVSPELRIDCPEEAKKRVVEQVAESFSDREISRVDGAKIFFDSGWALVRPSNTQPKMSVRCEADTEEDLESILEKVESAVREAIP